MYKYFLIAILAVSCSNFQSPENEVPAPHKQIKDVSDIIKNGLSGKIKRITYKRHIKAEKSGNDYLPGDSSDITTEVEYYDTTGFLQKIEYPLYTQFYKYNNNVLSAIISPDGKESDSMAIIWIDSSTYSKNTYRIFHQFRDTVLFSNSRVYRFTPTYRLKEIENIVPTERHDDSTIVKRIYYYSADNKTTTIKNERGTLLETLKTVKTDKNNNPTLMLSSIIDYTMFISVSYEYY
jgi:hypothetical protein